MMNLDKIPHFKKYWHVYLLVGGFTVGYLIQEHSSSIDQRGVEADPVFAVATITHATGNYKRVPCADYEYSTPPDICHSRTCKICVDQLKATSLLNGTQICIIYDAFEPCNSIALRSYEELIRFTTDSMARALEIPKRYRCED